MKEAGLSSSPLRTFIWVVFLAVVTSAHQLQALTITSGPVCFPTTNAPLAGELQITTDDYSRVSFRVDDGQRTWERNFYDYSTTHSLPLLGCRPGSTNLVTVVVHD